MEKVNNVFKEKSKASFDNKAEAYDESSDGKFVAPMYDEIIKRIISSKPRKLLDVGCGTGNILMRLADNKDIELYGIDISEKMIDVAKKNLPARAELKVGDSEAMGWENNYFDTIVCNASFHHYPNPKNVLSEMKRVLKNDGTLIIGDPTSPIILRQIINFFCRLSDEGDYKLYSRWEIEKLLVECGFEPFNFDKINNKSFAVNAKIKA